MGLFSSSRARLARSVVDCRLSGLPVRATTSQAMETTMARSRGGKDRLAATSGVILEVELATGPTSSPQSNGVGVKIDHSSGLDVGERGGLVQEQDQAGALPQGGRGRASRCESSGLGQQRIGEGRRIMRGRPGHEAAPGATGLFVSGDDALTLSLPRLLATLQLFAEWTTKQRVGRAIQDRPVVFARGDEDRRTPPEEEVAGILRVE